MRLNTVRQHPDSLNQRGINMVDLMMWLVIAALILAAALQGIGFYKKATVLYQIGNDLTHVGEMTLANASTNGGTIDKTAVASALSDTAKSSTDIKLVSKDAPWDSNQQIVLAQHPSITDSYLMYLFAPSGNYKAGVNIVKKSAMDAQFADFFAGKGPDPVYHPYMRYAFFDSTVSVTSNGGGFTFAMPSGTASDYKVEWSSPNAADINGKVSTPSSPYEVWGQYMWSNSIVPMSGGFKPGQATMSVQITNIATGDVSTKSWTLYTNGKFTLYPQQKYENFGDQGAVFYTGSKAQNYEAFALSTSNVNNGVYPTWSIDSITGDDIGATITGGGPGIGVKPSGSTGFKKGVSRVTVKATAPDGNFATYTVPITVVDPPMTDLTIRSYTPVTVAAGSTSTYTPVAKQGKVDGFYGSLQNDADVAFQIAPEDLTKINAMYGFIQGADPATLRGNGDEVTFEARLYPLSGGFKAAVVPGTIKITNRLTGKSVSQVVTITVQ